ncbi:hypothetical protein SCACP_17620 [Sporomusa carbonis]|uniref:indolepyruvate oxidoreductase subunit beta n=1 Tax=Sporomusa carbonis TaxID=3076075 RepID=UPI003A626ACE
MPSHGQTVNILIVGVGGQGTLLASKILGQVVLLSGLDVKQSEVHGMAQRGGSVVTYVRFADKVYSPLVEKGQADIVIAFEKLEALRWADYLKPGGTVIVNDQEIPPTPVIIGAAEYPQDIYERLAATKTKVIRLNGLALAKELGQVKALNVVLLGVAAKLLNFDRKLWEQAITDTVPAKVLDVNLKAFAAGWDAF